MIILKKIVFQYLLMVYVGRRIGMTSVSEKGYMDAIVFTFSFMVFVIIYLIIHFLKISSYALIPCFAISLFFLYYIMYNYVQKQIDFEGLESLYQKMTKLTKTIYIVSGAIFMFVPFVLTIIALKFFCKKI